MKRGSAVWLEGDWRGVVALTLIAGYVALLLGRVEGVEVFGVAVGLIVGWYFANRRAPFPPRVVKIPLATERHPKFAEIRSKIVRTLEESGDYDPAVDALLVDEVAKAVLDIQAVDGYIEEAKRRGLTALAEAVKVKAILLDMLIEPLERLAATREKRQKSEVRERLFARAAVLWEEETEGGKVPGN